MENHKSLWEAKCDCGNIVVVKANSLRSGRGTKSCGCGHREELIGKVFNRLTVKNMDHIDENNNVIWLCDCSCGNTHLVKTAHLTRKEVQSCGCLRDEQLSKLSFKHGFSKSSDQKEYKFFHVWCSMHQRCLNPKHHAYKNYGGRGITIDSKWLDPEYGFENFKADMWNTYEIGLTLDRINNELLIDGYSKANCKWVTWKKNQNNRRTSVISENREEYDKWNYRITATMHRVLHKGLKYSAAFEKYMGCTPIEFKQYIESLWEPWMNWDNYGRINKTKRTWQFDHIRPKNTFDLSKEKDRLVCFNYRNVRPLLALTNYTEKIRPVALV